MKVFISRRIVIILALTLVLAVADNAQAQTGAEKTSNASEQSLAESPPKAALAAMSSFENQSIQLARESNRTAAASAVAARRQADYAFLGTILVAVSAFLTFIAAAAGAIAAVFAIKSFNAVKVAERAYISAQSEMIESHEGLPFCVSNAGRTRAYIAYVRFVFLDKLPLPGLAGVKLINYECDWAIKPSETITIANIKFDNRVRSKYLLGYIEYVDVYRSKWHQHFRYDYDAGGRWVRKGGRKWSRIKGRVVDGWKILQS